MKFSAYRSDSSYLFVHEASCDSGVLTAAMSGEIGCDVRASCMLNNTEQVGG